MAPTIEAVLKGLTLGEAPYWDGETHNLYFVDIFKDTIGRYNYLNGKYTNISLEIPHPSIVIPIQNRKDHFIVSTKGQLVIIEWDGESDQYKLVKRIQQLPNILNDGKVGPDGCLWIGSHLVNYENVKETKPHGILYSCNRKGEIKQHLDQIKISNGLTFNTKTNKFYFIDSLKYCIDQYDYDKETGSIRNGRQFFNIKKHQIPGMCDGMTIDADGNLWVAIFDGGFVLKIDGEKPETLLDTIKMPTKQVTSVAFGGPNLDELFVTTGATSALGVTPEPTGGCLYRIRGIGVKGEPMLKFIVD